MNLRMARQRASTNWTRWRRSWWSLTVLACVLMSGCIGAATDSIDSAAGPAGRSVVAPTPTPAAASAVAPTPTRAVASAAAPTPTRAASSAADADVVFVKAEEEDDGTWTFYVTVQHEDVGWDDYADGWDVVLPGGTVVKPDSASDFTRTLLHPHVDEQPFTRSQRGIRMPPGVMEVRVRAHDIVDGFGGREVAVKLTDDSGLDFEVVRRTTQDGG